MKRKMGAIAMPVKTKLRLKDSVRTYIVEFLLIFAILCLLKVTIFTGDMTDKINECLKYHDLDYCNRNVD